MVQVCCEDHKIYDKVFCELLDIIHICYCFISLRELSCPGAGHVLSCRVNMCGRIDICFYHLI